jgi:hypothetical protein
MIIELEFVIGRLNFPICIIDPSKDHVIICTNIW